jgi:MFS family permease
VGALCLPFVGALIDRYGAKRVILVSIFFYGLTLCSALWLKSGLWQLYLLFALLGVSLSSGTAPVPYGVVISHWFNRHRGLALSLSMMGIGIGSVVVPVLSQRLIAAVGWRATFAIFGGIVLLLPLPVVAALLQNDPKQKGLLPDGDEGDHEVYLRQSKTDGLSWSEIWHTSTFWIMIVTFSLTGAAVHGAALHMSAILTDRGLTAESAAIATSLVGAAVLVGRLSSGFLLDRIFAPRVAFLFYFATTVGILMLCGVHSGKAALIAAFLTGLGMGAEVESMGYMVSRYFGLRVFGTAFGYTFGAFMISGSVGVFLMGAGYDRFHSYLVPLAGLAVGMLIALFLLTRLGPYRYGIASDPSQPAKPVEVSSGV